MMNKIEKIPNTVGGYSFHSSGGDRKSICKNNVTFFSNITEMNMYEEKMPDGKIVSWIIAKTFKEVVIFRIFSPDILLLLSVKGVNFENDTQVQFFFNEKYYNWDISNLEYIEVKDSKDVFKLKENEMISCFASSKISECKVKTIKETPPN